MSARHLSFLPQVTNVTSGDDFSKRRFWVGENKDNDGDEKLTINQEDEDVCPGLKTANG